jgi:hypothetical protein
LRGGIGNAVLGGALDTGEFAGVRLGGSLLLQAVSETARQSKSINKPARRSCLGPQASRLHFIAEGVLRIRAGETPAVSENTASWFVKVLDIFLQIVFVNRLIVRLAG